MDCRAWRNDRCKLEDCPRWDVCTLMNDAAVVPEISPDTVKKK